MSLKKRSYTKLMEMLFNITMFLSIITTGIVTGTVFAYANSVMPGLKKADDRTFVLTNRLLNASVDNPIFLAVSNIALIAQIGSLLFAISLQQSNLIFLFGFALLGYVATLLITILGNLPLNRKIITANIPKNDNGWKELREQFEHRWRHFNLLRTLTCLASVSILIIALLFKL